MNTHGDITTGSYDGWLQLLLRAHRQPSKAMHLRQERTVEDALVISRLRRTREQQGVPLRGIPGVLSALAAGSAEMVATAAAWAGLDLQALTTPTAAGAWGRLAAAIGLRRHEALLHLRITFLELLGRDALISAISARRSDDSEFMPDSAPAPVTVGGLNEQLERDARGWDSAVRQALLVCERSMEDEWPEDEAWTVVD